MRYCAPCGTGTDWNHDQLHGSRSYYFPADKVYDLQYGTVLCVPAGDVGEMQWVSEQGKRMVICDII